MTSDDILITCPFYSLLFRQVFDQFIIVTFSPYIIILFRNVSYEEDPTVVIYPGTEVYNKLSLRII